MPPRTRSNISGNMLIYILGAIFLLGVLIVLVKGSFQEGTGIDAEKVLMQVNEIQRFSSEVERGVSYILRDGNSETDLRFATPNTTSYGLITDIPARQVFSPEGGGVEWKAPAAGIQVATASWIFSGANAVQHIGSTCTDASCSDLLMILPNVTLQFCQQLNRNENITTTTGAPPAADAPLNLTTLFVNGTFTYAATLTSTDDATDGRAEGCFSSGGIYYYYRVLMAR